MTWPSGSLSRGIPFPTMAWGGDMKRLVDRAGVPMRDVVHIHRRTFARDAKLQRIDTQYILGTAGWKREQMLNRYTVAMREEEEDERLQAFDGFDPFVN